MCLSTPKISIRQNDIVIILVSTHFKTIKESTFSLRTSHRGNMMNIVKIVRFRFCVESRQDYLHTPYNRIEHSTRIRQTRDAQREGPLRIKIVIYGTSF